MKRNHRGLEARVWRHLLLAGACLGGLGCGAAERDPALDSNTHSDAVAELSQELRGRGQRGISQRRPSRGFWHGRGHTPPPAPAPPPAPCGVSSFDELFEVINADLSSVDDDDLPFARYFTLQDRARQLGCGAALSGERAALTKLLNSLSRDPTVTPPLAIDADETVFRIDLRNYQWDADVSVGGEDFPDGWEALIASSPYALEFTGEDAEDAKADTGTAVPVLLGGAFVAAAARAPLYLALLGIPADVDDFVSDDLGVDVGTGESVRAGFSAAAQGGERDFLAERFDLGARSGYVWQISDFGGDLFADPLAGASGERELTFTLPNGLLAHVLADGNGRVKDTADVLLDPAESDGRARIATSFFASRAQGMAVTDEVRDFTLANPGNFSAGERAEILALYPDAAGLEQLLAADRDNFVARALARLDLDIETEPEPISQSFRDFSAPVDAAAAAAALFISTAELLDNLFLLDPGLEPLVGGTVSREVFTSAYRSSLCILGAVLENQLDPGLCP